MTIPLQTQIVYGPLNSRRFGNSLGINLLPDTQKLCTFDCLYCQYGDTRKTGHIVFPSLEQIEEEADAIFPALKSKGVKIDWITLSGNGEPTLHPDFESVVEILLRLRDQYLYAVPVGILSNASTCHRQEIRQALSRLEGRFMKLDAGRLSTFNALNKPSDPDAWNRVMEGLHQLHGIVLQSMFVTGRLDNTSDEEVEEWIKIIHNIRPEGVQVYTVERTPEHPDVLPVPQETLQTIANRLMDRTRIPAFVYD